MSQERLEQNNQKSELRSRIDFQHMIRELSENRKDSCEVIRELISNSYDADASSIKIFPLLQYQGFIFFDNGIGLSENKEENGIIPYESFGNVSHLLEDSMGLKRKLISVDKQTNDDIMHHNGFRKANRLSS
jgi:hypothetical protein